MVQKIPEQLEILDVLPRNPTGKVLKHELRKQYARTSREAAVPLTDELKALAARVSNWGRWGPDDQRGTLNLIDADAVRRGATRCGAASASSSRSRCDADGPQTGRDPGAQEPQPRDAHGDVRVHRRPGRLPDQRRQDRDRHAVGHPLGHARPRRLRRSALQRHPRHRRSPEHGAAKLGIETLRPDRHPRHPLRRRPAERRRLLRRAATRSPATTWSGRAPGAA